MAEPFYLKIRGGRIVNAWGSVTADVAIRDGRIAAIGEDMPAAQETIDAGGALILPGIVDAHAHFREPGYGNKETWAHGSRAAAAGGVTTVLEMPNTDPPTATVAALAAKRAHGEANSLVDFGLYALLSPDSVAQIEALAAAGAIGFKCFLGNTFGDLVAPDDGVILQALRRMAGQGLRCAFHAENSAIIAAEAARLRAEGRSDLSAHRASRPDICEVEAVSRLVLLAEEANAPIHIVHLSAAASLPVLTAARARGADVTVETCPQYLFLTEAFVVDSRGAGIVNPPIRGAEDGAALWSAARDGRIDTVGSDHAPHHPGEKLHDSVWDCIGGMPGIETMGPVLIDRAVRGEVEIERIVALLSDMPARIWNIGHRKGRLVPGADADLLIVDPAAETLVNAATHHSLNPMSPWEGTRLRGAIRQVIRRGETVAENGQARDIARDTGRGIFLTGGAV